MELLTKRVPASIVMGMDAKIIQVLSLMLVSAKSIPFQKRKMNGNVMNANNAESISTTNTIIEAIMNAGMIAVIDSMPNANMTINMLLFTGHTSMIVPISRQSCNCSTRMQITTSANSTSVSLMGSMASNV